MRLSINRMVCHPLINLYQAITYITNRYNKLTMKRNLLLLAFATASMAALAQQTNTGKSVTTKQTLPVTKTSVALSQQPYVSQVWNPDLGNGMYKNPVINADYSDPDVVCVGDDFYMTASSFNCIPGLPILHSKDLVNWEIIGRAVTKLQP